MKFNIIIGLFLILPVTVSCIGRTQNAQKENIDMKNQSEIYLAGGCFWGTEHFMKQIPGVSLTQAGYANGSLANPTYKAVCEGSTGFAETVKVVYNSQEVSLSALLELYFKTVDPTTLNRQGGDRGTQYRTGIYYTDSADLPIIQEELRRLALEFDNPLQIEVEPLKNFYAAEDYHQDYLDKNPAGYCHINPQLFEVARKYKAPEAYVKLDDATLRSKLTPMQYQVTQESATELPFQNSYFDEFRPGIYVDITTGEPLFISSDKFESGCGWPSFSKPIDESIISEHDDRTRGRIRVEVRSKIGEAHLGHVFTDGPADAGGLRYCINSAALRFIPQDQMETEGYGNYLYLLDETKK